MTQDDLILSRLQEGRTITPAEAASEWGILALHSAVARLRKRGYLIECEIRTGNGKRWGRYQLLPAMEKPHFPGTQYQGDYVNGGMFDIRDGKFPE